MPVRLMGYNIIALDDERYKLLLDLVEEQDRQERETLDYHVDHDKLPIDIDEWRRLVDIQQDRVAGVEDLLRCLGQKKGSASVDG